VRGGSNGLAVVGRQRVTKAELEELRVALRLDAAEYQDGVLHLRMGDRSAFVHAYCSRSGDDAWVEFELVRGERPLEVGP
jgi:hypothetical protein